MVSHFFSLLCGILLLAILELFSGCQNSENGYVSFQKQARKNAILANEGLRRCQRYMHDWLKYSDPETGLIPRNIWQDRYTWNTKDAAADNYPFMVLTSSFTNPELFDGPLRQTLESERTITTRLGGLPDAWSFETDDFIYPFPDTGRIIFGASEYIKDGLLPLLEWFGSSPWAERLIELLDEIWRMAPVMTPYGPIPSNNVEINGEMLQVLSRIYWFTGDQKYLDWAIRLGNYYLLGDKHPTRDSEYLRLRDHGCEIVSGLCELYVTVAYSDQAQKEIYEGPIHLMIDRILEKAINEHGMFYNIINPVSGNPVNSELADTWGYTYNGIYSVYLIDGNERYRDSIRKVLENVKYYRRYKWEGNSTDGYADAIEGALNLYNREHVDVAANWLDSEIQIMWGKQDLHLTKTFLEWAFRGIIEGWHGDGNFARTSIMYVLWKSQGAWATPWTKNIKLGAVPYRQGIIIAVSSKRPWKGKIHFDTNRHSEKLHMPIDYPRINQFPEWFCVSGDKVYEWIDLEDHSSQILNGQDLLDGFELELDNREYKYYLVKPQNL